VVYDGIKIMPAAENSSCFAREQMGISGDVFTVGDVGALTKEKGHEVIIRAAAAVLRRGIKLKLIIAGSGAMEKKLKKYVSEKNIEDSVLFTGFRKDILQLFPAFDIFVNASESEGLGTSILDAMASGCAVVASDAGGIPEIIKDASNGFLFKHVDAVTLTEKIIKLAGDEDLRKAFAEAGRKTAEKFSAEKTSEGTLSVYREVLNDRV
ncbi:glycosyltransferase family 4 protein, partial [bacterium]|nr:glycosyltransferase family 4 protein [bacterium]